MTILWIKWQSQHTQSHWRVLLNAFLIFVPQLVSMAGKATFKPNMSSCSLAKQTITVRTDQKKLISSMKWICHALGNVDRNALKIIGRESKIDSPLWIWLLHIYNVLTLTLVVYGCVLHPKASSTRWRSTHCELNSPPTISIQWTIIVKYSFMHLEYHRSHVKAGFASFQLLYLLYLLIPSAYYKLDIYKNIQCKSEKDLQ